MTRGKMLLTVVILLVVCLGLGFAWGASGRLTVQKSLDETRQQLDLGEARGQLLDARVSLYNNNFGDATRHFEDAKAPLRRLKEMYQGDSRSDAAAAIDAALARVDEAQRLSGKLDGAANSKAGEALDAIKTAAAR